MVQIRKNTFETNSSSTNSLALGKDGWVYNQLSDLFTQILACVEVASSDTDLIEVIKKLHKAIDLVIWEI